MMNLIERRSTAPSDEDHAPDPSGNRQHEEKRPCVPEGAAKPIIPAPPDAINYSGNRPEDTSPIFGSSPTDSNLSAQTIQQHFSLGSVRRAQPKRSAGPRGRRNQWSAHADVEREAESPNIEAIAGAYSAAKSTERFSELTRHLDGLSTGMFVQPLVVTGEASRLAHRVLDELSLARGNESARLWVNVSKYFRERGMNKTTAAGRGMMCRLLVFSTQMKRELVEPELNHLVKQFDIGEDDAIDQTARALGFAIVQLKNDEARAIAYAEIAESLKVLNSIASYRILLALSKTIESVSKPDVRRKTIALLRAYIDRAHERLRLTLPDPFSPPRFL